MQTAAICPAATFPSIFALTCPYPSKCPSTVRVEFAEAEGDRETSLLTLGEEDLWRGRGRGGVGKGEMEREEEDRGGRRGREEGTGEGAREARSRRRALSAGEEGGEV